MDGFLASHFAACEFDRAIGDHLVGVHIGLRAAAGLPNAQREVIVKLSLDHLVRCLYDQLHLLVRQFAQFFIHERRGFLENTQRSNHLARHPVVADVEVVQRPLSLSAPVAIGSYLDRPHRVGFCSGFLRGLFRGLLSHRRFRSCHKKAQKAQTN